MKVATSVFGLGLLVALSAASLTPVAQAKPTKGTAKGSAKGAHKNTGQIQWRTNYAAALAESKKTGKPVFIDFYTDWCGVCKYLDQTTYRDAKFIAKSRSWIMVKLNPEKSAENLKASQKYNVSGFPTLVFADARGKALASMAGVGQGHWSKWLAPVMDKAQENNGALMAVVPQQNSHLG